MSNMQEILPYTWYVDLTKLCSNKNIDSQINHLPDHPQLQFFIFNKEIEGKHFKNVVFTIPHCIFAKELLLGGF